MHKHILYVLLTMAALPANADTIWLKNGDRINGTIDFKNNDQLLVRTSYAGTISIHWNEIVTLETTAPILLTVDGEDSNKPAVLDIAEDGSVICKTCTRKIIPLTAIHSLIYPRPVIHDFRTEGNIDISSNFERKKNDVDEFKTDAELRLYHGAWRHLIEGEKKYKKENDDPKDNNWNLSYKLDHFFNDHLYLRGTTDYKRDHLEDLTRTRAYGFGPGYLFRDDKLGRFDLTSSLTRYLLDYEFEFSDASLPSVIKVNQRIEFNVILLSWEFEYLMAGDRISIYSKGDVGFPDIDGITLITESESGLKYHFNSWTFATLRYEFDEVKSDYGNVRNHLTAVGLGLNW